jgi:hypothetical protein
MIIFRCASKLECYYDAYIAMKHNPGCGSSSSKTACHYCCKPTPGPTSPCNTDPVPKNLVDFGGNSGNSGNIFYKIFIVNIYFELRDYSQVNGGEVLMYRGRWPSDKGVCLSTQRSWLRALLGSRPCFFIRHQYWMVPGSGLESD